MSKNAFVYTFGCKVNQYESQLIKEYIEKLGYKIVDKPLGLDIAIINTCSVTEQAEKQARQYIRRLLSLNDNIRLIITGCYAERNHEEIKLISPRIEIAIKGKERPLIEGKEMPVPMQLKVPISNFYGHTRAFVKIQDGCFGKCSYCVVPFVRSTIWSKPLNEVISEIQKLIQNGYPEIVLSGIRLGSYKFGLLNLLKNLIKINMNFRIRLSSIQPNEIDDNLINFISEHYKDKICPHLHIPLQSASNNILRKMNRPYTIENYLSTINKIIQNVPDVAITTDIIVGFPGETEEDFEKTYRFIDSSNISKVHVFRFSPRPGTEAFNMSNRIDKEEINRRLNILLKLNERLQRQFWLRFSGTNRRAILEEGSGNVITDNYIRAHLEKPYIIPNSKIFEVSLFEYNYKPYARLATCF